VVETEGIKGFWKGLAPTALRSGLTSGVYFLTLRRLETLGAGGGVFWDGVNSTLARSANCFLLNPLTILELRCQIPGYNPYPSMGKGLASILSELGLSAFTTGIAPVLYKEGSFGAIYYSLYQHLKEPAGKMTAGMFAGMVATIVSHPF
jgi:hypothetical protein